jgi:hypothetical protein
MSKHYVISFLDVAPLRHVANPLATCCQSFGNNIWIKAYREAESRQHDWTQQEFIAAVRSTHTVRRVVFLVADRMTMDRSTMAVEFDNNATNKHKNVSVDIDSIYY